MDQLSRALAAWTPRRVMLGTVVVIGVLALAYLMVTFYSVLVIMFIAFVLSTAIRPLVHLFQRFKIPPNLGVILAYLLLIGALAGLIALLTPLITNQITAISAQIPAYYDDFRHVLVSSPSTIIHQVGIRLPVEPPLALIGLKPTPVAAPDATVAVEQLFSSVSAISTAIFVIIATLLLGFYWTLDGERVVRTLLKLAAPDRRDNARAMFDEIQAKMGAYIRGQIILDAAIAALATVAYLLIGLDYALILGLLAGLCETIPILGPILGAVPPALIALASGDTRAFAWVIVATVVIQQLEGSLLVPRVMDRAVGVNGLVTLLAFAAFTSVLGLVGGMLAVPLAAIVQIMFVRLVLAPNEVAAAITRRDKMGVLRYEAQELAQTLRMRMRDEPNAPPKSKTERALDELEDQLEHIALDLDELLNRASLQEEVAA